MKALLILTLIVLLSACDPGLTGEAKVYNDSNTTLTIKYKEYKNNTTDTITSEILPNQSLTIEVFGGLGNKSTFNCCPYDRIVSIRSGTGSIKKQSLQCDSWEIPNKNKLKKFGGEAIKCEFHISQIDL